MASTDGATAALLRASIAELLMITARPVPLQEL